MWTEENNRLFEVWKSLDNVIYACPCSMRKKCASCDSLNTIVLAICDRIGSVKKTPAYIRPTIGRSGPKIEKIYS